MHIFEPLQRTFNHPQTSHIVVTWAQEMCNIMMLMSGINIRRIGSVVQKLYTIPCRFRNTKPKLHVLCATHISKVTETMRSNLNVYSFYHIWSMFWYMHDLFHSATVKSTCTLVVKSAQNYIHIESDPRINVYNLTYHSIYTNYM